MASAGESTSQWSLFGLDLERYFRSIALGVHQLFWGSESGLQKLFLPQSWLLGETQALDMQDAENFCLSIDSSANLDSTSVLLPGSVVLTKRIELPLIAEPDLESIVRFEAELNSPFPVEDTRCGYRILVRDELQLTLILAIASRQAIESHLDAMRAEVRIDARLSEVWASHEGKLVQFAGFGEAKRKTDYLSKVSRSAIKIGLFSMAMAVIVWWPEGALSIKQQQLQELLAETEMRAGTATAARNSLLDMEDRLTAASAFYADRLLYDRWLDHVAALTPDSAYLTSMSFDKDRLTISGQAANAAELQTTLANAEILSEVTAPSAFTRDRRTDKERFTLTMQLVTVQQ